MNPTRCSRDAADWTEPMGYLAISRKQDERMVIRVPPCETETVISCVVANIRPTTPSVRLAWLAPSYVVIDRDEVDQAKEREKAAKLVAT